MDVFFPHYWHVSHSNVDIFWLTLPPTNPLLFFNKFQLVVKSLHVFTVMHFVFLSWSLLWAVLKPVFLFASVKWTQEYASAASVAWRSSEREEHWCACVVPLQSSREAVIWMAVHHKQKKALEMFAREIAPAGTGMGGWSTGNEETAPNPTQPSPALLLNVLCFVFLQLLDSQGLWEADLECACSLIFANTHTHTICYTSHTVCVFYLFYW